MAILSEERDKSNLCHSERSEESVSLSTHFSFTPMACRQEIFFTQAAKVAYSLQHNIGIGLAIGFGVVGVMALLHPHGSHFVAMNSFALASSFSLSSTST